MKTLELAPLTSALQGRLSSPVPLDSPSQVIEEMELPSTPDTFEAVRDLITMTALWSMVFEPSLRYHSIWHRLEANH